jgi:hypothetical protein
VEEDPVDPTEPRFPHLRIVPTARLLLHEECDPERVARLSHLLTADGVLRNPPIAASLDDGTHVVLDGANRVTALRHLGIPDQVVQVVDYGDPGVQLDTWAHLLRDDDFLLRNAAPPPGGWRALDTADVHAGLAAGLEACPLACGIITPNGAFGLPAGGPLAERVRAIAQIVAGYTGRTTIYRVQATDLEALAGRYGQTAALVVFPRLTKPGIRTIARLPDKLPTGISRHIVPLRALRVNVDLALLRAAEPLAVKQARLDEEIRTRLLGHRVRHYPEATVLFDE